MQPPSCRIYGDYDQFSPYNRKGKAEPIHPIIRQVVELPLATKARSKHPKIVVSSSYHGVPYTRRLSPKQSATVPYVLLKAESFVSFRR